MSALVVCALVALVLASGLFFLVIRMVAWRYVLPLLALAIAVTAYGTDITPALDSVEQLTTNLFGGTR